MKKVYLICGVPGSGKTWVSKQLAHKFEYIPHDMHYKDHAKVIAQKSESLERPIITECPFAERELRAVLTASGLEVKPYFVVEHPDVAKARYESRENKPFPKNNYTRASSISKRADEWQAPKGTSQEVLELLNKE